ncbi:MAG: dihydropteroate synthase-like protein [Asgard group archaeon]|nr:dihydropteroate synthase-like protein [Asgard group archaeon]
MFREKNTIKNQKIELALRESNTNYINEERILGKTKPHDSQRIKILAITGRLAADIVKQHIPKNVDLVVLPVNVAAFITNELIKQNLGKEKAAKYDLILTPGLVQEDLAPLKKHYKIPVVKGPQYASDIKTVLKEIDPFSLSTIKAADKFLKHQKIEESKNMLKKGFSEPLNKSKKEFSIGQITKFPVGVERPPLVMAEIVDATNLTNDEIISRANYYIKNKADILDIGAVANKPNPSRVVEIINLLEPFKQKYPIAISIDTLNVEEIKAAIQNNIDLVLSIDNGNIDSLIDNLTKEIGTVIVPTDVSKGYLPKESNERINSLLKIRDKLRDTGLNKIIADPIIEMPIFPGFAKSLNYYSEYRKADPVTPMMTCVGNVTEFIAADPIGINALFGSLAVELGIQLLLVTDVSVKCRGGIKETVKARDLSYIAQQKSAPPKGHGIELLMAKSRTDNDLTITQISDIENIDCPNPPDKLPYSLDYEPDPKGSFTIWIDYHKQRIFVIHLENKTNKPTLLFSGEKARQIFEAIIDRELVSKIGHAYYLGRELERAEICLYLGKTYIQNEQVFSDDSKFIFEK